MKEIIITLLILVTALVSCVFGFYKGKVSAFNDIVSEKCWLNKQSRDIECIEYID